MVCGLSLFGLPSLKDKCLVCAQNGVRIVLLWLAFARKQLFGLGPNGVRAVPLWLAFVTKQMVGSGLNVVRAVHLRLAVTKKQMFGLGDPRQLLNLMNMLDPQII